jgi:hypothetical protein
VIAPIDCTADEVRTMTGGGLTDAQVRAACGR